MKKLYSIPLILIIASVLLTSGCDSNKKNNYKFPLYFALVSSGGAYSDTDAAAYDTSMLEISYLGSDSAVNVTQNITLPTNGPNNTTIAWFSSDTAVVAIDGTVTRPRFGYGNATVTLIATIIKGNANFTKTFVLMVIQTPLTNNMQTDEELVAADKAWIEITYSGNDTAGSVTQDIALPVNGTGSGTTITWTSNNNGVISINGTVIPPLYGGSATVNGAVTRPEYGSGNASVIITATITKGIASDTKIFVLNVIQIPTIPAFNMVLVPGKTFKTGVEDSGTATVSSSYYIGETEVTYELWSAVYAWAKQHGYTFANAGGRGGYWTDEIFFVTSYSSGHETHPVTIVNWRDSMVWCNALTEYYNSLNSTSYACVYKDGGIPIRDSRNSNASQCDAVIQAASAKGFRLLTKNEWELAARFIADVNNDGDISDAGEYYQGNHVSGDTTSYCAPQDGGTSTIFGNYSWYSYNSDHSTHPVKEKTANALGLYDMSGSVMEWCFDLSGSYRVNRGGSWYWHNANPSILRVGYVNVDSPDQTEYDCGFRLGRTP